MKNVNQRRYEMLGRVRDFGTKYAHLFPESTLASQAFAEVSAALEDIQRDDLADRNASVSARSTRTVPARKLLLEELAKIAQTARVIAETTPAAGARFELPEAANNRLLLSAARQFADNVTPLAAQFIAHGMAPTFVGDLQQLIDSFDEALRDRGTSRGEQVAARTRIRTALSRGLAAVRRLDVIIANHLASNPATREVWKRDRRVEYAKPRKRPLKGPTDPTASPEVPGTSGDTPPPA